MAAFEYRVRWRREDRGGTSTIYQTEEGARAKIDRLLALEEVKGDTSRFEDMPDLIGVPTLERREVGSWELHPEAPATTASDEASAGMAVWVDPAGNDPTWGAF